MLLAPTKHTDKLDANTSSPVEFSFNLRKAVEARVIEPISLEGCIFCKSSTIIKWGIRHNKYGDIQKFSCKSCGKFFTVNLGFEKMKHNPQAVTTAMQLSFAEKAYGIPPVAAPNWGRCMSPDYLPLDQEIY